jgi:hypothetical protein
MSKYRPAVRRAAYTGQNYQHALESLRRDSNQCRPIPIATKDQSDLEALFLERLAGWRPDVWHPDMLAFGVAWVDPAPECITIAIPTRYLPNVIREIIPTISNEDTDPIFPDPILDVGGIPGLRFTHAEGRVLLYRPDRPGRIIIPIASPDTWDKAVTIGLDILAGRPRLPWQTHPRQWHPAENRYEQDRRHRLGIDSEHYRASQLASDVLRRLPGLCAPFAAHDMWFNRFAERKWQYQIHFEWQNSGPPHQVLDLLLHPAYGLDAHLVPCEGLGQHSAADCYTDACYRVRLADPNGCTIDLRHLRDHEKTSARQPM